MHTFFANSSFVQSCPSDAFSTKFASSPKGGAAATRPMVSRSAKQLFTMLLLVRGWEKLTGFKVMAMTPARGETMRPPARMWLRSTAMRRALSYHRSRAPRANSCLGRALQLARLPRVSGCRLRVQTVHRSADVPLCRRDSGTRGRHLPRTPVVWCPETDPGRARLAGACVHARRYAGKQCFADKGPLCAQRWRGMLLSLLSLSLSLSRAALSCVFL